MGEVDGPDSDKLDDQMWGSDEEEESEDKVKVSWHYLCLQRLHLQHDYCLAVFVTCSHTQIHYVHACMLTQTCMYAF